MHKTSRRVTRRVAALVTKHTNSVILNRSGYGVRTHRAVVAPTAASGGDARAEDDRSPSASSPPPAERAMKRLGSRWPPPPPPAAETARLATAWGSESFGAAARRGQRTPIAPPPTRRSRAGREPPAVARRGVTRAPAANSIGRGVG